MVNVDFVSIFTKEINGLFGMDVVAKFLTLNEIEVNAEHVG